MPSYYEGNWEFGISLASLLDEAKMLADVDDFQGLGSSDAFRNNRVARLVNRAVSAVTEANPALGTTFVNQTLTSGTSTYDFPVELHGQSVEFIRFQDTNTDAFYDLKDLNYIGEGASKQLPLVWRNGEQTAQHPKYWPFNPGGISIQFFPAPSDSTVVVEIWYRRRPNRVTPEMLSETVTVQISDFASDSIWTKGTGWTISGGTATFAGTSNTTLTQGIDPLLGGRDYLIEYDIPDITPAASAISLRPSIATTGGNYTDISRMDADQCGTHRALIHLDDVSTTPMLTFTAIYTSGTSLSLDNVSVDVAVGEVMYEFAEVYALHIAIKLAEASNPAKVPELIARYKLELKEMRHVLTRKVAAMKAGINNQSFPSRAIAEGTLLNLGPANAGRYNRSGYSGL